MKSLILMTALSLVGHFAFAQTNAPRTVTPQILQKLKADIEKEIPAFKQELMKQELTADQIEFAVDTFRIEHLVSKRMDIDYSTQGMNKTVLEMAASYDKLMNKYYGKLLKVLKPQDRKTLIEAQKAWLSYRNAEIKLIAMMTKEEYSGGGTIQSNIAVGSSSDLSVKRAIEIFNYYSSIIKDR